MLGKQFASLICCIQEYIQALFLLDALDADFICMVELTILRRKYIVGLNRVAWTFVGKWSCTVRKKKVQFLATGLLVISPKVGRRDLIIIGLGY
jgi:hypothetical protein